MDHATTRRPRSTRPSRSTRQPVLNRHGGRARGRSTRSARTSAAVCRPASRSQWFECPCHGSQYNQVGEKKGGPAPRGMDRFATEVAGGVLTVEHRHRSSRARRSAPTPPARRPRARTASVAAGALMPVTRQPGRVRWPHGQHHDHRLHVIAVVLIVGFVIAGRRQHAAGPQAEVGSEIELAANRKPYLTDEELEGKKLDRTLGFGLVLLAVIAVALPAVLAGRAGPPGRARSRPSRTSSSTAARTLYNDQAPSARTATARRASAACATYTSSTPTATSSPRSTGRRRRSTPCCSATPRTRSVHPQLRPARHADAGVGRARRWSAHRAADRQRHRLPPAASSSRPDDVADARLQRRDRQASCKPDDDGNCTPRRRRPTRPSGRRSARPSSTSAVRRLRRRRLLVRALPHQGLVLRRARGARWRRRPRPQPHRRQRAAPVRDASAQQQSSSCRTGSEQGKLYGKGGIGAGQMPGFGVNPNADRPGDGPRPPAWTRPRSCYTQDQIAAVVAYERSL